MVSVNVKHYVRFPLSIQDSSKALLFDGEFFMGVRGDSKGPAIFCRVRSLSVC